MKGIKKPYNRYQLASAVCMIIALLWLTVSTPFVFACQQELVSSSKMDQAATPLGGEEEEANPFGTTTEEKAPTNSSSFSEEYLHDHHTADHFFLVASQFHKCENAGLYIAFHGELLVPPPNRA